MSFSGELEHLPIVDVIQLLHSTRKTGTLCVRGGRGECQLVFNEGYITSANHANTSVRIGKILVDMGAISREVCDAALTGQKDAGAGRKPLVATLIEEGGLKKEDAYRGLRSLIEMTVVEMLRWTKGTFILDVNSAVISDEYRYFPEMLHQEINLDTQRVLMDALRIFDEESRDGEEAVAVWEDETALDTAFVPAGIAVGDTAVDLSADDLGLGDIDQLERKIPDVFASIELIDPAAVHRKLLNELWPSAAGDERERMVEFFTRLAPAQGGELAGGSRGVVFCGRDRLVRHGVMTICKSLDILSFITDDERDLDLILEQSLCKGMVPVLMLGAPDEELPGWSALDLMSLRRQKRMRFPQLPIVQLAVEQDGDFVLQSYQDGVLAVIPRPRELASGGAIVPMIWFFEVLLAYLRDYFVQRRNLAASDLSKELLDLAGLCDAPEISHALLQRLGEFYPRVLTLIVRGGELLSEKGIGFSDGTKSGAVMLPSFTMAPASGGSLRQVLETGRTHCGAITDTALETVLWQRFGAPRDSAVLLLPIVGRGRVIAVIYGDFGDEAVRAVPLDYLRVLAAQAGLVLENAIYRRQLEKTSGR
ncbi:DUF4388 domain-containing protein [Trichloromonas sp.]|uniref:DUF4388 domain-containing protein n=1 Tax=Trichloromonas sp. TaxID=3069249 RepID=UPI002A424B04|nr:DUF4388 domain-containing protein [Trichloromonas sp.]